MSLSLLLLSCASVAGVQDAQATVAKTENPYTSLDALMATEVELAPSAEARREATEDGEVADRPTGSISDLVLHKDGSIGWAAVSVGGILGIGDRTVLIETKRLQHVEIDGEESCRLGMTKAELEALPEFDLGLAKEDGKLFSCVCTADASFSKKAKAMEASKAPELCFASELLDMNVRGTDDEFGGVSNAIVNGKSHKVEYLIVTHGATLGMGGDDYIVPLAAVMHTTHEEEPVLSMKHTCSELERCIRYTKPENGFVDMATLKSVDAHFKSAKQRGSNQ